MISFLANNEADNHLNVISGRLTECDEAFFAVAFLKVSGLNTLIQPFTDFLKSGGTLTILAGQNFALTEPQALHTLRHLFASYPASKVYLAKAVSKTEVFHPKLYLFRSEDNCCVISGSANITKGGLTSNKETSLVADCQPTDAVWISANSYYEHLVSPACADEAELLIIKQYETYFEQQKRHNKESKPIPDIVVAKVPFAYPNLLKHYRKFDGSERLKSFQDKSKNYKEAKNVLNEIADNSRLTRKQFEPLLDRLVGCKGQKSLWYSGSLYRKRRSVYQYYKQFRDLVLYIREHRAQAPSVVFEKAKVMIQAINGAGVNYLTEIMMTYNPKAFANMNDNPLTVLRVEGRVNIKASPTSYSGNDYQEYCDLIGEISAKLGLKNMLEADSFFNEIYWKLD